MTRKEAVAADVALAEEALAYFADRWKDFDDVAFERDSPPELLAAFRARCPPTATSADGVDWVWSFIYEGRERGIRDAKLRRSIPRA